MPSLTTLRRRLHRWRRYAEKTCWSPRHTLPGWCSRDTAIARTGHWRAWVRYSAEVERRQCRRWQR